MPHRRGRLGGSTFAGCRVTGRTSHAARAPRSSRSLLHLPATQLYTTGTEVLDSTYITTRQSPCASTQRQSLTSDRNRKLCSTRVRRRADQLPGAQHDASCATIKESVRFNSSQGLILWPIVLYTRVEPQRHSTARQACTSAERDGRPRSWIDTTLRDETRPKLAASRAFEGPPFDTHSLDTHAHGTIKRGRSPASDSEHHIALIFGPSTCRSLPPTPDLSTTPPVSPHGPYTRISAFLAVLLSTMRNI